MFRYTLYLYQDIYTPCINVSILSSQLYKKKYDEIVGHERILCCRCVDIVDNMSDEMTVTAPKFLFTRPVVSPVSSECAGTGLDTTSIVLIKLPIHR